MKRIYVAGKYSANNVLEILQNIGRGEAVCAELFKLGYAPFCPWHDKQYCMTLYDEAFTVQQFYDYSMAWLDVSDAVFLVEGWADSKGTLAEIERANILDIPIFESIDELDIWRFDNE